MRYSAFAIDLDGTLLDGETVPQKNIDALKAAIAKGIYVIIATARWKEKALEVQKLLGVSNVLIACSGAQVFDPQNSPDEQDVFSARLPEDFTRELYAICNEERCIATITSGDRVCVKLDGEPNAGMMGPEMSWAPALDVNPDDLPRIGAIQGSKAVARIKDELQAKYASKVNIFDSIGPTGRIIITITAKIAEKGTALAAACAYLEIDPTEVVAFGDAENDLAMFRYAGAAVAMGQADDEVKAAATFVSLPHEQGGVGHAVNLLLEQGEFPSA